MEISINGTLNINGNISIQDNGSAEETLKELLDNTATFKDLLAILHERAGKNSELVKAKRCPGSEQLRSGHELIARIAVGEATCEVFENGYAVFDNGDRKTVVWVPDCPKAARYYYPATSDEKCKEEHRNGAKMTKATRNTARSSRVRSPGKTDWTKSSWLK